MSFYWFDLVAAGLLGAFAYFSWRRGFVAEFFKAAAWVAGYFSAAVFYARLSAALKPYLKIGPVCDIAAFLLVFFAGYLAVRLAEYLVREKLGLKVPRGVDGPAGALMGALKFTFFLAMALLPLNNFPSAKRTLLEKSYIAAAVYHLSDLAAPQFGVYLPSPGKIKEEINGLKEKIPTVSDIKEGLPSIPNPLEGKSGAGTSSPKEQVPRAMPAPVEKPAKPSSAAQPASPKRGARETAGTENHVAAVHGPSASGAPKSAGAVSPVKPKVKTVEPVIKNRPEPPAENERKEMDQFIDTLN